MQITKKVIAPLLIMILLAGAAGIMSSREISINRANTIRRAASQPESLEINVNSDKKTDEEPEEKDSRLPTN